MTCAECSARVEEWLAGRIEEHAARDLEAHAAGCESCAALLDRGRITGLASAIAPPAHLRDATLAAVRRRRLRSRWLRTAGAFVAAAAAITLVLVATRSRPESPPPNGAVDQATVIERHAAPQLAELDAAERDVVELLRGHPGDRELLQTLSRIQHQRAAMQQLVADASS